MVKVAAAMPTNQGTNRKRFLGNKSALFPLLTLVILSLFAWQLLFLLGSRENGATTTTNSSSSSTALRATRECETGVIYRQAGVPALKSRDDLGSLMEKKGFETGVEVGVQEGDNAKKILSDWPSCKEFHLVDLWAHQANYKDIANVNDRVQEWKFKRTQQQMEPWKDKVKYHRMSSVNASQEIANQSLDFAYLDARHDYCGVMEDIRAYWPKLRPGGIMAGHDYLTAAEVKGQDWSLCADGSVQAGAVRGAVEEFATEQGLVISVTYNAPQHGPWQSWMVQKPTKRECVESSEE